MATQKYTICLIKNTVTTFADALDSEKSVTRYDVDQSFGIKAAIFVGTQSRAVPKWVELINPFLQTPIERALLAHVSAVFLAEYEGRLLAICFGHGRTLLAASSWVRDFGLKVTLNRVAHDQLRSIDTKTYDEMVLSARKQTSKSSGIENFEIDVSRNLVRGVTGKPRDTTFFRHLSGADSLTVTTELPFEDVADLFDELLAAYTDTAYQKHFKWIDNVKEVDPLVAAGLDAALVEALRSGTYDGLHLAPADVVSWDDIRGFNFTGGRPSVTYPELALEDYLNIFGDDRKMLTLPQLKRNRVKVRYEATDELRDMWQVYDCVVWETVHNGQHYALFDGRWFEVDSAYIKEVEQYVKSVSKDAIVLPDGRLGDDESVYNEAVVNAQPADFALMDKVAIRAGGAATPIELCDILSVAGHFIHVKKRTSSATLSHLFAQGSVACEAFVRDADVRRQAAQKLKTMGKHGHLPLMPADRPVAAKYAVVYAILAKPGKEWPPPLPFFSAVNLMHHCRRVEGQGFQAALQHVKQL